MSQKPFPWKCPNCRQRAVNTDVVDYSDAIIHDGREYQVIIKDLPVPKCRNCGHLVLTDDANRAIDDALRAEARLLTPDQIRRNREALGLTQKQMATQLAISDATLSRWETGTQIQQRSLDRWMRAFFSDEDIRRKTADEAQLAILGVEISPSTFQEASARGH